MKKSLLMKSKMLLASLMLVGLAGVGCNGGGGGGGGGVIIDPVVYLWYDMYGNGCSTGNPRPGCNFYWYDANTLVKIIDSEDPYVASHYNLSNQYVEFYLNGVLYFYEGWIWISPTGIIYDEFGDALNKKKSRSRDMVGDVARKEKQIVEKVGREFAAKYSLDAKKGVEIAQALNEWATIGKDRQRTDADLEKFTTRLYGVEYNQVKKALEDAQKGDKALLNETIGEAARNWGITAENMKGMLKKWYKNAPGLE